MANFEAFQSLDALPLIPNGKIDRGGMPMPDGQGEYGTYVAPRTSAEAALCKIWEEVLKIDRVGVNDDFFDLGGDSINMVQITVMIRKRLKRKAEIVMVQVARTVANLAVMLPASKSKSSVRRINTALNRR